MTNYEISIIALTFQPPLGTLLGVSLSDYTVPPSEWHRSRYVSFRMMRVDNFHVQEFQLRRMHTRIDINFILTSTSSPSPCSFLNLNRMKRAIEAEIISRQPTWWWLLSWWSFWWSGWGGWRRPLRLKWSTSSPFCRDYGRGVGVDEQGCDELTLWWLSYWYWLLCCLVITTQHYWRAKHWG